MDTAPMFLFLAVAAVAVFSFISIVIWTDSRRKEREAFYKSETTKKFIEVQGNGGRSVVEYLREEDRMAMRRKQEGMRLGGLIVTAVGVGLIVFLRAIIHEVPVYLVGLIPLLVGVVLLAYSYLLAPRDSGNGEAA